MGVLPIIAFLILDSFAGQKKALIGALMMAMGEVVFSLIKFGAIDYLTWIAFGILAIFVGLSLWKKNDIFFKIQGPVINVITAVIIWGALFFLNINLLHDMTEKYMGLEKMASLNPMITPEILKVYLEKVYAQLPAWLLLHAGVTLWAALKWNKWVWAAIRVPGFYIIMFIGMMIAVNSH